MLKRWWRDYCVNSIWKIWKAGSFTRRLIWRWSALEGIASNKYMQYIVCCSPLSPTDNEWQHIYPTLKVTLKYKRGGCKIQQSSESNLVWCFHFINEAQRGKVTHQGHSAISCQRGLSSTPNPCPFCALQSSSSITAYSQNHFTEE